MSDAGILSSLRSAAREELVSGILPFWLEHAPDREHGGFVGAIDGDGRRVPNAPKGAILNARILWTFSAASAALRDPACAAAAGRAASFLRDRFLDPEHGGVVWMLDACGRPADTRKHVYAQAFAIYALAEHHRAAGDGASLQRAVELFRLVELHARDAENGGYREAFSREWCPLDDVRLGATDADEPRSMNTHLHLLEAYTTLYRVWPDPLLRHRLRELVALFVERIVGPQGQHAWCFFDERWNRRSEVVSFGHDIEASWLLLEAADALGEAGLRDRARDTALRLADGVWRRALDREHGGIYYDARPDGRVDTDKEWWPQAEAVVAFLSAHRESGEERFLLAARSCWDFISRHLVDRRGGEWHRRTAADGSLCAGYEKAGPWKGPYHNGRACLEILARTAPVAAPARSATGGA